MTADEERHEEEQRLRVTDRRRFTETGEERDAAPESGPAEGAERPGPPETPPAGQPDAGQPDASAGAASAGAADAAHAASAEAFAAASEDVGGGRADGTGLDDEVPAGIEAVFFIFWQGALVALGAQDASGRSSPANLAEARQAIELLRTLEEKTRGNLTEDEQRTLRGLLHDAQLKFVQVAQQSPERPS